MAFDIIVWGVVVIIAAVVIFETPRKFIGKCMMLFRNIGKKKNNDRGDE